MRWAGVTGQANRLELEPAGVWQPPPLSSAVRYLVWGLIALAVVLRVRLYFSVPSLWLDEALLAADLVRRPDIWQQMHAGATQTCPVGYLVLVNGAIRAFGTSEYALYLVSLLAALAGLIFFYFLARRSLGPAGLVVAVCLFAFAPKAVRYASEVKPYGMDLMVATAFAYLGVVSLKRELDWRWTALLAGAGVAALACSFPSVFVLAGFGSVMWGMAMARKQWRRALMLTAVGTVWLVGLGVYYAVALRTTSTSTGLQDFWGRAFMPLPPKSLDDLMWFRIAIAGALKDPGGLAVPSLAAVAFLLGSVRLARRDLDLALAVVAPIAFVLLASGFKKYPFSTRLLVFSLPFMYLPIAAGAELIWTKLPGWRHVAGVVFILVLAGPTASQSLSHLITPEGREEMRPVLAYVAENRREGDVLYVFRPAAPAYRYYAPRYGLADVPFIRGQYAKKDWKLYEGDVQQLKGKGRTWVIFSHLRSQEQDAILGYLDALGTRLSDVQADGSSAYLYDMKPAPASGP